MHVLRLRHALWLPILLIAGCGGSNGGGIDLITKSSDPPPATAPNITITQTESGVLIENAPLGLAFSGSLNTESAADHQYQLQSQPDNGQVSVSENGDFSYQPQCWPSSGGCIGFSSDQFNYQMTQEGSTTNLSASIQFIGDPLFSDLWHLFNTGQTQSMVQNAATAGEDIGVTGAYQHGLTGQGVRVAVVDTGLELNHPDLYDNVVPGGSYNFVDDSTDPSPTRTEGDHGTSVAGLIAARGWNKQGGRGVAARAGLQGFNLLASQTATHQALALGGSSNGQTLADGVAIFNQSFGLALDADVPYDTLQIERTRDLLQNGTSTLRNGLGAIYIKAAGNGFKSFETEPGADANCGAANTSGLTCLHANMGPENTIPYNLVVGASDATGKRAHYSTTGSALLVTAPGGDADGSSPFILTTDQSGCHRGSHQGPSSIAGDPDCNYTFFPGTSAAAPVVSGVAALLLEADPTLTWREVRHILLATADRIDSAIDPVTLSLSDGTYVAEPGWTTNAAGYTYHNWYGFGRVNATAAVQMVKEQTYPTLSGLWSDSVWQDSGTLDQAIPDNSIAGAQATQSIDSNLSIEAVQIRVTIKHPHSGDLGIELISPLGTRSVLLTPHNALTDDADLTDMVLLSNAFYGESSQGTWTLKVVDAGNNNCSIDDKNCILKNWKLRILGH